MLTTKVIKGLMAGKIYKRKLTGLWDEEAFTEVKIDFEKNMFVRRYKHDPYWRGLGFTVDELSADWEEVTEWQEITWQEAVDCHNEGIPLQRYRLGEWIDAESELNLETLGFVCNSKWRKKVEGCDDQA